MSLSDAARTRHRVDGAVDDVGAGGSGGKLSGHSRARRVVRVHVDGRVRQQFPARARAWRVN